jgi:N-acetylglucosamine malate deacetylase 1
MNKKNVLIVVAHPDDEILGCGGLIAKNNQLYNYHVLILTDGTAGRYDESQQQALISAVKKANNIVGTHHFHIEKFPNQGLDTLPLTEIAQCVEHYIASIQPFQVYTHHIGDLNMDHRITHEAVKLACRPMPGQIVKELYSFYIASSTEWNMIENEQVFIPNTFVDIENVLDQKIKALACYQSENKVFPHPRSAKGLKVLAHYWGMMSGIECAEPFKLIRKLAD